MKKLLAVFLTVIMLVGTFGAIAVSASPVGELYLYQDFEYDDTYTLGDVNGDGATNSVDSLTLKYYIAGVPNDDIILDASDFDADGKLGIPDSYCLKTVIAGAQTTAAFENGNQIYKMTIGGTDITELSFVLPEGSSETDNTYFAYLNFMKYVREATGITIPMSWGTATTAKAIYFNSIDLKSEEGQALGIDGYRFDVTDGNLNIYGTYRGNGYAVFDILEEYLGFRFFHGNTTYLYKARTVDIPEGVSVEKIPDINFRHARQTFGQYQSGNSLEGIDMHNGMCCHYFANKLNASEGGYTDYEAFFGTKLGPLYSNAHSFVEYWQMGTGTMPEEGTLNPDGSVMSLSQRYNARMASGREYGTDYGKDVYSWQPCASSEEHFNILFEGMIACNEMVMNYPRPTFIEEGQTLFSFSISDNQSYCQCTPCKDMAKGKKDNPFIPGDDSKPGEGYSGLYLNLYNKATEKAQDYYPGVRLYGIVYAKDFPLTIKPHKNFVVLYCGTGCNNHMIGREECYASGGQLGVTMADGSRVASSNALDEVALPFWGNLCKETGAELWFWIYPVTYHYYLIGCPNVLNFYWDMKWLHEEANVTGFFYEGGGREYNFETLKEYASVKYMWDMDMTYEEWLGVVKEYLYMYYGDGYEELYKYIEMQTEAGDQCGTCFINNFDRPGDMYSYEYLGEHYDEMRELLLTAIEKADTEVKKDRIRTILVGCDFMGLTSVHNEWYLDGTRVDDYKARFDWMYDTMIEMDMDVFSSDLYKIPDTKNYDVNIMKQIYEQGSRRDGVDPYN